MAKLPLPSFFALSLYLIPLFVDFRVEANAHHCDEDLFYKPYIYVKHKKNGGNLASLHSTGFLDLRFKNRVILCINGPAVLYSDVERLDPESRLTSASDVSLDTLKETPEAKNPSPGHLVNPDESPDEELRFKKPTVRVFNHQCISVNKVPSDVLRKMREDQGKLNPELLPDTQVMGLLVLGVYLIGDKDGYNNPELAWFKGPELDYLKTKEKTVKDSSFLVSGSNTSHCMKLPDGTRIRITSDPHSSSGSAHEICKWTVKEEEKFWYAKLFQRGYDANGVKTGEPTLDEGDYELFECPDTHSDGDVILFMSRTTPEPFGYKNYTEYDPFAIINPNLWTPHGYRKDTNGLSGGDERAEDRNSLNEDGSSDSSPCSANPFHPGCGDTDDVESTTLRDMQNVDPVAANVYEIMAVECIALPVFDIKDCTGIADNGCRLLELTLELEPSFLTTAKSDGTLLYADKIPDPTAATPVTDDLKAFYPDWRNLNDEPFLAWKMDFLNLVADIFAQLCMPFRADTPYTLARVFGWYVYRAHMYGENMGRVNPADPPPAPAPDIQKTAAGTVSHDFDKLINKTDIWVILEKELERCRDVARKENNGKGLKFQWEIGDDSGKWKIPSIDGDKRKRRRKRSVVRKLVQPEYPTHNRKRRSVPEEEKVEKIVKVPDAEEEEVEEIDAVTGEKIVSRQKRSNRDIQPGRSIVVPLPEGNTGFVRETIQEYRPKPDLNDPRADAAKYIEYPQNVQHCWDPVEDPITKRVGCTKAEDVFFYEDRAEIEYELNIAIDLWWKIWATVIGYCNKAYTSRKSETFPRLYNSKYEYFFELVMKEWKHPQDNEDLNIIFSEYLTEETQVWMDTCLESAYINSNSKSYRPPRPMTVTEDKKEVSNYFEELPSFIYYKYHPDPANANK